MSGERLKREIEKLGMTTAEFSRLSEVSTRTISKIYNGEHVREHTLNKVWNALAVIKTQAKLDLKQRIREAVEATG